MDLRNATGFHYGVAEDETALAIESFKTTVEPEYVEPLLSKVNERRGEAIGARKKSVEIAGEVGGSTGLMAATMIAAFAPANSSAYFGAPTTGLCLRTGEVTEKRDGWKAVTATLEAFAGIP